MGNYSSKILGIVNNHRKTLLSDCFQCKGIKYIEKKWDLHKLFEIGICTRDSFKKI